MEQFGREEETFEAALEGSVRAPAELRRLVKLVEALRRSGLDARPALEQSPPVRRS